MISLTVRLSIICAGFLALPAAEAFASPVNISFNIDSFTSVVASPTTPPTHAYVNGQDITSVTQTQDAPFTVSGPLGSSVDFYEQTFSDTFTGSTETHNVISFTPGPTADVVVGQKFLFGTFNFTNGIWFGSADVAFTMTSVSADPALNNFKYQDTLRMQLNPFVSGNPAAGADFLYLLGNSGSLPTCAGNGITSTSTCSMRVYELFDSPILPQVDGVSNFGTIELFGMISSLDPLELTNPTGAMFLTNSINTGSSNIGTILQDPRSTPAPPALLLFISGLIALAASTYRRGRFAEY